MAAAHGLAAAVKLASNESPFGPLPGVTEAVAATLAGSNRYPDPAAALVAARFAAAVGSAPERVLAGPGSVGLLQQLALAYVDDGDEVVFPWPSFGAYPQFTDLVGGRATTVALRRQTVDVDALGAVLDERTRLVVVANPNNPTSTAIDTDALDRLVAAAPPSCLVVIDEAYREYRRRSTAGGADDARTDDDPVRRYAGHPNVAVLRTLSKAYGLAGLRVGFLVADPAVIDAVAACSIPFAVSSAAQAAAVAALEQSAEVGRRAELVVAERARVAAELRRRGIGVPESAANFLWLPAGSATGALADRLERRGIVTRPLGVGVRVTVGTPADNDRFLGAIDELDELDGGDLLDDWGVGTGALARLAGSMITRHGAVAAPLAELTAADWNTAGWSADDDPRRETLDLMDLRALLRRVDGGSPTSGVESRDGE